MNRVRNFVFTFLFTLYSSGCYCQIGANTSFVVIDLKYSEDQGVKICEMQPGLISMFKGYDAIYGARGSLAKIFASKLQEVHPNFWYIERAFCDSTFRNALDSYHGLGLYSLEHIQKRPTFVETAQIPPDDPHSIFDYQGLLIERINRVPNPDQFAEKYPGIMLIDHPFYPYVTSKAKCAAIFDRKEEWKQLRPLWNSYSKGSSKQLVQQILEDIPSEHLVIKPIYAAMGYGILLIHRDQLDSTLKTIFGNKKNSKKRKRDRSYSYWSKDQQPDFLVEEFATSDPIVIMNKGNKSYDGTIRVICVLTYNHHQAELHILGIYGKLPPTPLDGSGSFSDKHKSCAKHQNYFDVPEEIQTKIEEELQETIPDIYETLIHDLDNTLDCIAIGSDNKRKTAHGS